MFNNDKNGENKVYCNVLYKLGFKSVELFDDLDILETILLQKSSKKQAEYDNELQELKEKHYYLIITSGKFA